MRPLWPGIAAIVICTACTEPADPPGSLRISYSTQPGDESPFNWKLSIDGSPRAMNSGSSGSLRVDSLAAGSHVVAVSDLPTVCTAGQDTRNVEIAAGDTTKITVQVTCTRVTGDVLLTVLTSGVERDLDGYTLLVDGVAEGPVTSTAAFSRRFTKLSPGKHTFALSGVASNCTASTDAASPTVSVGVEVPAAIMVTCVSTTGTLRVITTTSGGATLVDPSGYKLKLDTLAGGIFLQANGTFSFVLKAGTYNLKLSDIEPNCSAAATEKDAVVVAGANTDVTFSVTCAPYAPTTAALDATDPAADTLANPANAPTKAFDIKSIATRYGPGFMVLSLKLDRTVTGQPLVGVIDFDLDENAATGLSPLMNEFGGTATQGVEAQLVFDLADGYAFVATVNDAFSDVRVTAAGDSVVLIIPFEKLDNDDGNVTITAVVGPQDRPTDWAPNAGVLVSHLPASTTSNVRATPAPSPARATAATARIRLPKAVWKKGSAGR